MDESRPEPGEEHGEAQGDRWEGRPGLARFVRAGIYVGPLLASLLGGLTASRLLPPTSGLPAAIGRFAVVALASTVVLVAVDRAARRLLPMAALLQLALAFPDRAPSRFSVALRSGSSAKLERHLEKARDRADEDDPTRAAAAILSLLAALNLHDRRTRGHSERVRAFVDLLAEEMHLSASDRDRLRWAGLLHDVGKLHVTGELLNKPGKPDSREWEALKAHPTEGARLIAPLAGWLGPWAATVEHHHERWDGTGYPNGLSGEEISLGGRMVAVADAYEVMTAARPYQRPLGADAARKELAACADGQFDPAVVRAFLNISIGRLRAAIGPLSWLAQVPFLGRLPEWQGAATNISRQAVAGVGTTAAVGAMAIGSVMAPGSPPDAPAAPAGAVAPAAQVEPPTSVPPPVPSPPPAVPAPPPAVPASQPPPPPPPAPAPKAASPSSGPVPSRPAASGAASPAPPSPSAAPPPAQPAVSTSPKAEEDHDDNGQRTRKRPGRDGSGPG